MIDKKLLQKLKDKGVSSDVILDLMLDEEQDPDPKDPKLQTDAILAAIEKLTGAVQAANMRNDYHGGESGDTVDDILGKIIK